MTVMDSRTRLLTAWSFREPDRVPIEIGLAEAARAFPEAQRLVEFVDTQADHFRNVSGFDSGFCGLRTAYTEEVIENVPGDYYRLRRVHRTAAGEFHALTKHQHVTLAPSDYLWERRYIETPDEMIRLADAPREPIPLNLANLDRCTAELGNRGLPLVYTLHPLGWLVRNANLTEVYSWFLAMPEVIHRFLEASNRQVAEAVAAMGALGTGRYFGVTAHEMLTPPWMGPRLFDEFVFPYDQHVNDAVHRIGGRMRAHCHGNCMRYLRQFAEMGIDSLEPLEHPPFGDVDLAAAKRLVGDRMLLSGNVASQNFLFMSRAEVRREVREAIRAAAPGGGFTLRPGGLHGGTDSAQNADQMLKFLDNIDAYVQAALDYGAYPIHIRD